MFGAVSRINSQNNRKQSFGLAIDCRLVEGKQVPKLLPRKTEIQHYDDLIEKVKTGFLKFRNSSDFDTLGTKGKAVFLVSKDGDVLIKGRSSAHPGGYLELTKENSPEHEGILFRRGNFLPEQHTEADTKFGELSETISYYLALSGHFLP